MGTDASSYCEWVELFNDGPEDASLSAWTLTVANDGSAPKDIALSGTVAASGLYVLARNTASCLAAEPAKSANLKASFGDGISNTASVLTLKMGGVEQDAVDASGGWSAVGGLNKSGEPRLTAQRAGAGWITAAPTPGASNATEAYVPPAENGGDTGSSKSNATANPGYVAPPLPQVFADAGGDRTVIVGADAKFVATAYDRDRDVINYAKFYWNFGDGTSKEGPEAMHHWSYPGRYAVELTVTNTKIKSTSRITVTAEPAAVTLAPLADGGVSIQNHSGRDLDLSFWQVRAGERAFALPEHSVALKDAAINIAPRALGFAAHDARLYYPDGKPVAEGSDTLKFENVDRSKLETPAEKPAAAGSMEPRLEAPQSSKPQPTTQNYATLDGPPQSQDLAAAAAGSGASLPLWASIAGLMSLVGTGVASVWALRRQETTDPSEEFDIE